MKSATSNTVVGSTVTQRWHGFRWVLLALIVIVGVATISSYLTSPKPGGTLEANSTSPEGARALVTLLRDNGVTVIEADTIADVEREARPGSLLVVAQTFHLFGDELLSRLAQVPGDRLLVQPVASTREQLAPAIRRVKSTSYGGIEPDCDLRAATQAGTVQFGPADAYAASGTTPVIRCYDGVVARYTDEGRAVTVVGSAYFVMNEGLLDEGNAALAMNLAGTHPRAVWYAPQRSEYPDTGGGAALSDLIPPQVAWVVWQLVLAVALLALWKGRRVGPLVAERLPVVVRASETVEGRGRLYRSRRARDRAAEALRTSTLQRMLPRLGLNPTADPSTVAAAVAARSGLHPLAVTHTLHGPAPATDADLVNLARELDEMERLVAQS
ncbi:membrane protein [Mycolicibacterium cyprinidarum]|uniref:Membrane protein n=1 Tax=Mycolicibacterium cyprinidarum TaxID=2860311 RepID=A0ABQ4V2W4_9MYCO|nr:membrane protein [Mycolicibacterium sp. NGTWSNA01]GJF19995.1 membrane protein [Mycolicibacterium sp. NGTWS0302]